MKTSWLISAYITYSLSITGSIKLVAFKTRCYCPPQSPPSKSVRIPFYIIFPVNPRRASGWDFMPVQPQRAKLNATESLYEWSRSPWWEWSPLPSQFVQILKALTVVTELLNERESKHKKMHPEAISVTSWANWCQEQAHGPILPTSEPQVMFERRVISVTHGSAETCTLPSLWRPKNSSNNQLMGVTQHLKTAGGHVGAGLHTTNGGDFSFSREMWAEGFQALSFGFKSEVCLDSVEYLQQSKC